MLSLKIICAFCNKMQNLTLDPDVPLKDSAVYDCSYCKSFTGELTDIKNKENLEKLT